MNWKWSGTAKLLISEDNEARTIFPLAVWQLPRIVHLHLEAASWEVAQHCRDECAVLWAQAAKKHCRLLRANHSRCGTSEVIPLLVTWAEDVLAEDVFAEERRVNAAEVASGSLKCAPWRAHHGELIGELSAVTHT